MGKIKILQFESEMNANVNYNCKSFVFLKLKKIKKCNLKFKI